MPDGTSPTRHVAELDALRGLAITLVVAFHVHGLARAPTAVPTDAPLAGAFVLAGHTGVNLFFVLSGFLLFLPYLRGAEIGRSPDPWRFYDRRLWRIMPAYALAVLASAALAAREPADLLDGLPYLYFRQGVDPRTPPLRLYGIGGNLETHWWSLATEAQFYLVLPWLAPIVARSRRGALLVGAAVVAAYTGYLAGHPTRLEFARRWLVGTSALGRSAAFGTGMLAAWVVHRHGERIHAALGRSAVRRWTCAAAVVALGCALATLLRWTIRRGYFPTETPPLQAWHVPEAVCWSLALLLVVLGRFPGRRLLVNRPLIALGEISYSVYLLHMAVLLVGRDHLRRLWPQTFAPGHPAMLAALLGLTLITVGLSVLTYRWIERPLRRTS